MQLDKNEFGFCVNIETGKLTVEMPKGKDFTPENIVELHLGAIKFLEVTASFFKMMVLEKEDDGG